MIITAAEQWGAAERLHVSEVGLFPARLSFSPVASLLLTPSHDRIKKKKIIYFVKSLGAPFHPHRCFKELK